MNSGSAAVACRHCGWDRTVKVEVISADGPTACVVCDCQDLWRQKDFPPQLGLAFVGCAIVCSTIAVAYMRPVLALSILMGFALLDMLLFLIMKDRLVCYRCHAVYRQAGGMTGHQKFNLELNERYRQEQLRQNALGQKTIVPPST